jgi:hypothetical protein
MKYLLLFLLGFGMSISQSEAASASGRDSTAAGTKTSFLKGGTYSGKVSIFGDHSGGSFSYVEKVNYLSIGGGASAILSSGNTSFMQSFSISRSSNSRFFFQPEISVSMGTTYMGYYYYNNMYGYSVYEKTRSTLFEFPILIVARAGIFNVKTGIGPAYLSFYQKADIYQPNSPSVKENYLYTTYQLGVGVTTGNLDFDFRASFQSARDYYGRQFVSLGVHASYLFQIR